MNLGELIFSVGLNSKDFTKGIDKVDKQIGDFAKSSKKNGKLITQNLTIPLLGLGAVALKFAADAETAERKFNIAFGSIAEAAEDAVSVLVKEFDLASSTSKKLLGDTGDLLKGFGATEEAALKTSLEVQKLAAALAAHNGLDVAYASEIITKGVLGETEGFKQLGVSINQAAIDQQKLVDGTKNLIGVQGKLANAQAIIVLATQQSTDAIASFDGNDTLNKSLADIKEDFKDIAVSLGNTLMPTMKDLTKQITYITDALSKMDGKWFVLVKNIGIGILAINGVAGAFNILKSSGAKAATGFGIASKATKSFALGIGPAIKATMDLSKATKHMAQVHENAFNLYSLLDPSITRSKVRQMVFENAIAADSADVLMREQTKLQQSVMKVSTAFSIYGPIVLTATAIIGGMAIATIALTKAFDKQAQNSFDDFNNGLVETEENIYLVATAANQLEKSFQGLSQPQSLKEFKSSIASLSAGLGLSEEHLLEMILNSKVIGEHQKRYAKTTLETLKTKKSQLDIANQQTGVETVRINNEMRLLDIALQQSGASQAFIDKKKEEAKTLAENEASVAAYQLKIKQQYKDGFDLAQSIIDSHKTEIELIEDKMKLLEALSYGDDSSKEALAKEEALLLLYEEIEAILKRIADAKAADDEAQTEAARATAEAEAKALKAEKDNLIALADERRKNAITLAEFNKKLADKEKANQRARIVAMLEYANSAMGIISSLAVATKADVDEAVGDVGALVTQIGQQSNSAEAMAVGLAIQLIAAIWGGVADMINFQEQLARELADVMDDVTKQEFDNRKKYLEEYYKAENDLIDSNEKFRLDAYIATLTAQQVASLKAAGIIEEQTSETIKRESDERLEEYNEDLAEMRENNSERLADEIEDLRENLAEASNLRLDNLREDELQIAQTAAIKRAAVLDGIEELTAAERAIRIAQIDAEEQLELDAIDTQRAAVIASAEETAGSETAILIAELEARIAAETVAEETTLANKLAADMEILSQELEIQKIKDAAEELRITSLAEQANGEALLAYNLAVFNKGLKIQEIGLNLQAALSNLPWYASKKTKAKVIAAYAEMTTSVEATPMPPMPTRPQMAEGGIVNPNVGGTPVTIGEAGSQEAVIPLNDKFFNRLADAARGSAYGSMGDSSTANGQSVININLDGKIIASSTVDLINNRQFVVNATSVK